MQLMCILSFGAILLEQKEQAKRRSFENGSLLTQTDTTGQVLVFLTHAFGAGEEPVGVPLVTW